MDYRIILPKTLKASVFAKNWNDSADCREIAEAHVEQGMAQTFDPLVDTTVIVLSTLSGLSLGIASNALYDLIKQVFLKQGFHKKTEIIQHDSADGSRMLIIRIIEE